MCGGREVRYRPVEGKRERDPATTSSFFIFINVARDLAADVT